MKRLMYLFTFVPVVVRAEVMDKEPSLIVVWCGVMVGVAVLFAAARYRPWMLVVVGPIFALLFGGQLLEVIDPHMGPAILREAGTVYVVSSWAAPAVLFSGMIAGFWLRHRTAVAQQVASADGLVAASRRQGRG